MDTHLQYLLFLLTAVSIPSCSCGILYTPKDLDDDLIFIGNTSTKEFYVTQNVMADFATSLRHICENIFNGLQLAAVEDDDELSVIDSWLQSSSDDETSSDFYWTSAFDFGDAPILWATGGSPFQLNAVTSYQNPAAEYSPQYSWFDCLGVFLNCNRPPGASPGCYPLRTEFVYEDCREERRVLCQRTI